MSALTEAEITERSRKIKMIQFDFKQKLSLLLRKQLDEIESLLHDFEQKKIQKLRKSLE